MRSTVVITLVLLVAAFAVAQDTTSPSTPANQSQTQNQRPVPEQSATPASPADAAAQPRGEIIEGCLGGADPKYTVTDKNGVTYQLLIPKGADASVLAKHIGESVQVQASGGKAVVPPANPNRDPGSAEGSPVNTIQVAKIGRGTGTCPASPKPPSK